MEEIVEKAEALQTLLTRAGKLVELVANPIPNTMASGLPTNLAISCSSPRIRSVVPAEGGRREGGREGEREGHQINPMCIVYSKICSHPILVHVQQAQDEVT